MSSSASSFKRRVRPGLAAGRRVRCTMSNPSRLLPFQPMSMTTAQLAAVSFLARYAGHTHELYSYQLRRWFEWCERWQRAGPAGRDPTRPRRAAYPWSGRVRSHGVFDKHDDARGPRVLPVRPHRRPHPGRPGCLRAATEGAQRRVPDAWPGPARTDPHPPRSPRPSRFTTARSPTCWASTPCERRRRPLSGSRTTRRPYAVTGSCTWWARATSPPLCR